MNDRPTLAQLLRDWEVEEEGVSTLQMQYYENFAAWLEARGVTVRGSGALEAALRGLACRCGGDTEGHEASDHLTPGEREVFEQVRGSVEGAPRDVLRVECLADARLAPSQHRCTACGRIRENDCMCQEPALAVSVGPLADEIRAALALCAQPLTPDDMEAMVTGIERLMMRRTEAARPTGSLNAEEVAAKSIVVSAKLDGIATLMRRLTREADFAATVHDDRFVAAMRATVQEIWRELEDMGARARPTGSPEGADHA